MNTNIKEIMMEREYKNVRIEAVLTGSNEDYPGIELIASTLDEQGQKVEIAVVRFEFDLVGDSEELKIRYWPPSNMVEELRAGDPEPHELLGLDFEWGLPAYMERRREALEE